jgi:hypothetical protein
MSPAVRVYTSTGWQDIALIGPQGAPGSGASDATASSKGSIQLAGDLAGTAALPQIAPLVIVDGDVSASAAIAESKLALASDAAVGTASRRTLGPGAQQAMPGNRTLDAINPPIAPLSLNGQKVTNLANPSLSGDAASKGYVDGLTKTFRTTETFAVMGAIAAAMNIPGAYEAKAASETLTLVQVTHRLRVGTATVQVRRNGTQIGGNLSVTTGATTTAIAVTLADFDYLDLNVTAATGASDLTVSMHMSHVV